MVRFLIWTAMLIALGLPARADVPAPTSIVIVACRVDDLTGQPGRQDPTLAARDWRDLELHVQDGEYQCKRIRLDLEDGAMYGEKAPREMIQLSPDFGAWDQCARVGVMQAADWNAHNPGWGVVAVGCPTRIVNEEGATVGWKLPGCPSYLPGTDNRMRCVFDESAV